MTLEFQRWPVQGMPLAPATPRTDPGAQLTGEDPLMTALAAAGDSSPPMTGVSNLMTVAGEGMSREMTEDQT